MTNNESISMRADLITYIRIKIQCDLSCQEGRRYDSRPVKIIRIVRSTIILSFNLPHGLSCFTVNFLPRRHEASSTAARFE